MKNVTTYVGIDAHKKDLFVAMLIGNEKTPVTWQLANEPRAVHRLVRKLERRDTGADPRLLRGRAVWLRLATAGDDVACELRRDRACADSAEAW